MTTVAGHPRVVRAATGTELRCRGWRQEGILRMLENTVQNGERPEELVIYGGTGQAARDWRCFDVIVESLLDLHDDETLVIQSGKPVARFRTHEHAPRVLTANAHLVGRWANWETFHEFRRRGLIMFGQYTAGAWEYIGQQGILQSTYETLAECARQHFDGSLRGRLVLTTGLGAMGAAQPLAVTFLEGVTLVVEIDEERVDRRIASGYLDRKAHAIEEALALCDEALAAGRPLSVGLVGNAADVLPALAQRGLRPDVVTDQTSAHDPRFGYAPLGYSLAELARAREEDPERVERDALQSIASHVRAMVDFQDAGAVVFEYGNAIREQAQRAGFERAQDFQGFVPLLHPPELLRGARADAVGCAVRRSSRPAGDRRRGAGALRRRPLGGQLDHDREGPRAATGPAGADVVARPRATPRVRHHGQPDGLQRSAVGAGRDEPRPPRLRLGRPAHARNREHGRRLGSDR